MAAVGVHNQFANVALAGGGARHGGGGVQVDVVHIGVDLQHHFRAHSLFIHINGVAAAIAGVAHRERGAGSLVGYGLKVAGNGKVSALTGLQKHIAQALGLVPHIVLNESVGLNGGFRDVGAANGPQGDELACGRVHQHFVGLHAVKHNAGLTVLALAAAGNNNAAQDLHVFQHNLAQAQAAADVQVAGNGGVPQGYAGGVDGYVAKNAALFIGAGLVQQVAQARGQHFGHLAPGDAPAGPEGTVAPAADDARQQGRTHIGGAPGTELTPVGKFRNLAGALFQPQAAGNQRQGLLSGHLAQGLGGGGGGSVEDAGFFADGNVVIEPVLALHVRKGDGAGLVKTESPVQKGHHLGAGHLTLRVHVAAAVAPHDAPFLELPHIGVGPAGGAGLEQAQWQHAQKQGGAKGQRGQTLVVFFEDSHDSSFLWIIVVVGKSPGTWGSGLFRVGLRA